MRAALAALALCTSVQAAVAVAHGTALRLADEAYSQGRFGVAVNLLEAEVERRPGSAEAWLLLGRTYGRLAERAPWYEAVLLARRCGLALERAVELAPRHPEAVSALVRFYEEAPALVGGGEDRAAALRARPRALPDG